MFRSIKLVPDITGRVEPICVPRLQQVPRGRAWAGGARRRGWLAATMACALAAAESALLPR